MSTLYAERLMKLARFLHNDLPEEKFDFSVILSGKDVPNEKLDCGTVGCAIGWCPLVFPEELKYAQASSGTPIVLSAHGQSFHVSAHSASISLMYFFDLTNMEAKCLFVPNYAEDSPNSDASAKDVARHIAGFVAKKYSHYPEVNTALDEVH